jgi:hypothetical protein
MSENKNKNILNFLNIGEGLAKGEKKSQGRLRSRMTSRSGKLR